MFCKSGILIFIFVENNYSIYAHTMLIKTPLLHQSSGPHVFLSLSLPLFFRRSLGAERLSEFTFLPRLLRPSQEGALHLHSIERAPEASVNRASPVSGALLAFCVNQGLSASFSLLYFLIIDSGPPGSNPLKDLNTYPLWHQGSSLIIFNHFALHLYP